MSTKDIIFSAAGLDSGGGWLASLDYSTTTTPDGNTGVALDSAGNIFVLGRGGMPSAQGVDMLLAKYSPTGVLQWQRRISGAQSQYYSEDLLIDSSDNLYIYTSNTHIIKLSNTGTTASWQKLVGNIGVTSACLSKDGYLYFSGYSTIMKMDSAGTFLNQNTFTTSAQRGTYNITINEIVADPQSNEIILVGKGGSQYTSYSYIFKLNSALVVTAALELGGTTNILWGAIALDCDGDGNVYFIENTGYERTLTKTDKYLKIVWSKIFDGIATAHKIAVDRSGFLYIAGNLTTQSALGVSKINTSNGTVVWSRSLVGISYVTEIIVNNKGKIYISASTYTSSKATTVCLADNGTTLGTYIVDGQSCAYAGITTTTTTASKLTCSSTFWIEVYKATGSTGMRNVSTTNDGSTEVLWEQAYGGPVAVYGCYSRVDGFDLPIRGDMVGGIASIDTSIYQSADDSAGNSHYIMTNNSDLSLIKVNSTGTLVWRVSWAAAVTATAALSVTPAGICNIVGTASILTNDIVVMSYSALGSLIWQATLSSAAADTGIGIVTDSLGNVYITGSILISSVSKIYIAKYSSTGILQWQKNFTSTTADTPKKLVIDTSDNIYLVGQEGTKGLLLKFDSAGEILLKTNLAATSIFAGIALGLNGDIFVCGTSSSHGIVLKYDSTFAIIWQYTIASAPALGITYNSMQNSCYVVGSYSKQYLIKFPTTGLWAGTYTINAATYIIAVSTVAAAISALTVAIPSLTNTVTTAPRAVITNSPGKCLFVDPITLDICTVYCDSSSAPSSSVFVNKMDYFGNVIWSLKTGAGFGGGSIERNGATRGLTACKDISGNIYVAMSYGSDSGCRVSKITPAGVATWEKDFKTSTYGSPQSMCYDATTDTIFVTGSLTGAGNCLMKINPSTGALLAVRQLNINMNFSGDIISDNAGNVLINTMALQIMKINTTTLATVWAYKYSPPTAGRSQRLAIDSTGAIYLGASYGSSVDNPLLVKISSDGATVLWAKTCSIYGRGATAIAFDASDNVYVGFGQTDLVKFDSAGNLVWKLAGVNANNDIQVVGNKVFVTSSSTATPFGMTGSLPTDGSVTGSHGSYNFTTSTLTFTTPAITVGVADITSVTYAPWTPSVNSYFNANTLNKPTTVMVLLVDQKAPQARLIGTVGGSGGFNNAATIKTTSITTTPSTTTTSNVLGTAVTGFVKIP
jgi:hypothetical protein